MNSGIVLMILFFSFLLIVGQEGEAQESSSYKQAHGNPASSAQGDDASNKAKEKGTHVKERGGSIGIFGCLIPKARGRLVDDDEYYAWNVSGGIGIFGEYRIARFFSLGLEFFVSFPRMEIIGWEGEDQRECHECKQHFLLQVLSRWKFPIEIRKKKFTIYPIIYLGYSGYIARYERHHIWIDRAMLFYHGIGFGWGFGLEYAFRYSAIFLEIRWPINTFWNHRVNYNEWTGRYRDIDEQLTYFGYSIHLGLKFP